MTHPLNPGDEARETDVLSFTYTNWRGETALRRILTSDAHFAFGSSPWHPQPQFLLRATDADKGELRDFAVKDIVFATLPPVEEAATVPGGADDLRQRLHAILEKDRPVAAFKTYVDGSPVVRDGETDFITAKAAKAAVEDIWNDINAALTASEAVGTVPREATMAMVQEGVACIPGGSTFTAEDRADIATEVWEAMWDAAQSSAPALAGENVEAGNLLSRFKQRCRQFSLGSEWEPSDESWFLEVCAALSRQAPKDGIDALVARPTVTPEQLASFIDQMAENPKGGKMAAIAYKHCARLIRGRLS